MAGKALLQPISSATNIFPYAETWRVVGVAVYILVGSDGVIDVPFVVGAASDDGGISGDTCIVKMSAVIDIIHSVDRVLVKMAHGDAASSGCA